MSLSIERIDSVRMPNSFINLPYKLYRDDPNWVPPLRLDERSKLNRSRHPFWKHAEGMVMLARRDARPVGRMVAIHDRLWQEANGENAAYWGWFECADDREAAQALFREAETWAKERGCERIIGPMSPNPSDLIGCLVEGFDGPPLVMMPYNPPYYDELIRSAGHSKWKDLLAWLLPRTEVPERLERVMPRVEARGAFKIRKIDMKDFDNEVIRFADMYNNFERVNALFTPMTEPEIDLFARDLKMAIDPDIVFFVEVEGRVVGVSFALPDMNIPLKAAYGRLFPFGIFRLLAARKKIRRVRVLSMGVDEKFRNRGIDLAMHYYGLKFASAKGYTSAEMSWVEEDNAAMANTAAKLGGVAYRKYRVYEKKL